jgi:hypothetical protein
VAASLLEHSHTFNLNLLKREGKAKTVVSFLKNK